MRRPLHALPLRWLLPCSIFGLLLPCLLLIIYLPLRSGSARIETEHRQFLHHQLANLQLDADEHPQEGNLSGISRQITLLATLPEMQQAALLDEQGQILYSPTTNWRDRPINQALPHHDAAWMRQARERNRGVMTVTGERLTAYYPIKLPAARDTIEQGRAGGIYVEYSLGEPLRQQLNATLTQGLLIALITIGAGLLLIWLLRHWIERPIQALMEATQSMTRGDFHLRFEPTPGVELVRLNHAFRRLGIALARNRQQLHLQQSRWLAHV
ncbi:MAG: HAMP domain-containing protein, partial [Pseudomonadales bacterium]|nr:HAMP domain-containing protein [Pseudomonadales bacterium]